MKKLMFILGAVILGACSKLPEIRPMTDASVSEKSLNQQNCNFKDEKGTDGKVAPKLNCADAKTVEEIDAQMKALDAYLADSKGALKKKNIFPKTRTALTDKQMQVFARKQTLIVAKTKLAAAVPAPVVPDAAAIQRALEATQAEAATRSIVNFESQSANLTQKYGCTFRDDNSLDYNIEEIKTGDSGDVTPFVQGLTTFVILANERIAADKKIAADVKAKIDAQVTSVTQALESIQSTTDD